MKISIEAKVGLIGIATLVVLIWGINYLKGRNILKSTYTIYAFYDDSGGVESSAPVLMNGIKIGYIDAIDLKPEAHHPVKLALHIEKDYPIKLGSSAVIFSTDLLGSKAIRIDPSGEELYLSDQDTIRSAREADLFSSIGDQVGPVVQQISQLATSLDTLAVRMSELLSSEASQNTLEHVSDISNLLKTSLEPGGSLYESFSNLESFSSMLVKQEEEIASMTSHLNSVSEALDSAGIDKLSQELMATTLQFKLLLEQVNSGQGTAGKLIYSDSLYYYLENLVSDLDSLILDLNENPQDYVRFSLFGKSQK